MKPTLKQVQFLTSRGITMPRSKTLAFKLISFLKHGYHPDSLTDEWSRIAFVKSTQAKWLDQRIMHSCGPGQVISISARTIEGSIIQMSIEDNGVGFATAKRAAKRMFGITAMQERIETLGGQFRLKSRQASSKDRRSGTRIDVDLPITGVTEGVEA